MSETWIDKLAEKVAHAGAAVRVVVIRAEGSTPRETGAAMVVTERDFEGTIGGGTLEFEALASARALLKGITPGEQSAWTRKVRTYPLGPALGQCCGGAAKLLFEVYGDAECRQLQAAPAEALVLHPLEDAAGLLVISDRKDFANDWPLALSRVVRDLLSGARPRSPLLVSGRRNKSDWFVEPLAAKKVPLYLYGAGHVGRAVVAAFAGLPFDIVWVDTGPERFPAPLPSAVQAVVAADPVPLAAAAPAGAFHVVMTYSHPMDLAICHAVLAKGRFAYLGVIGSKTKHARFTRRLRDLGMPDLQISRLVCPIGLAGLSGKEPPVIAVSLAADLLQRVQRVRLQKVQEDNQRLA